MKQGDEGNHISFDEDRGLVLFTKMVDKFLVTRTVHISACAWVETEEVKMVEQPKK